MQVRFTSFNIARKETAILDKGHTTRVSFSFPHRMMLQNLNLQELLELKQQCEALIARHWESNKTIYLGSVEIVEEVED